MPIARAFTLRHKRKNTPPSSPPALPSLPASPKDAAVAVTHSGTVVDRSKISKPIELISTTNMLSYNAPDVATVRKLRQPSSPSSSSSTTSSSDESDARSHVRISVELTDASSVEESPSPTTPEHNHLSCFFDAARKEESPSKDSPTLGLDLRRSRSISSFDYKTVSETISKVPAIPHRAPSHSKSAHVKLARKRSLQSLSSQHSPGLLTPASTRSMYSPGLSRASSLRTQRTSSDLFRQDVEPNHPFGKELEQLSEVSEEFFGTIRDAEAQEDEAALKEHGLLKWSADEYLSELIPLYTNTVSTVVSPTSSGDSPQWI